MLLTGEHLRVLDALATYQAAGQMAPAVAEHERENYRLLELEGLARLEVGPSFTLTDTGREAARLLGEMRQQGLLPPTEQIAPTWRFLGSEVLAALAAAGRTEGRVGPLAEDLLRTRGLAQTVRDPDRKTSSLRLNAYGTAWLDLIQRTRPRLEISGNLANSIHHMPPAYADPHRLDIPPDHRAQLEAMRLLVWSVPDRVVFTLTALGNAVYEALRKGGYPVAEFVLDETILAALATLAKQGAGALPPEQLAQLQMLGYADPDAALLPAGEAALRARRLREAPPTPRPPATIAINRYEAELLIVVRQLAEGKDAAAQAATKTALRTVLVDRLERRYQEFAAKYGRKIEETPARKRQAQAMVTQLRERDRAFGNLDVMDEWLVHLESFALLRGEGEGRATVYRLTPNGQRVIREQGDPPHTITGMAVKAITITTMAGHFYAPAAGWLEQARAEELIGPGGITSAGHFYAWLAEHAWRVPALTRQEARILRDLPQDEVPGDRPDHQTRRDDVEVEEEDERARALDRLEAHGLIERQVDGQIVRTAAGQLLTRAVAGALELAYPVTPAIVRLLLAIRQVGESLHVKEEKVRTPPRQWAEVERLTGLGPDEFQETVQLAGLGKYLGEATLTEAGSDVLEALARSNHEA